MLTDTLDRASFACVSSAWQAHEGKLLGYLRHRLSDVDAADDVLQDVFVKAMRHGLLHARQPACMVVPCGAQCLGRSGKHGAPDGAIA